MASRLVPNFMVLLLLLSLVKCLCFWQPYLIDDVVMKSSRTFNNSFNKVAHNNTIEITGVTNVDLHDDDARAFGKNTGSYPVKNTNGARMFYYFYESKESKSDPFILWLSGGPGISPLTQVFGGSGPFRFNDDLTLKRNPFSWDSVAHMLYVDQPIGVGYSTCPDNILRRSTNQTSSDLYDFLQSFFKEHREFTKNDFYIVGGSYAGKTIPALASLIHNNAKEDIHINLKGIAIGNGLINPMFSYSYHLYFAYMNKLISKREWKTWQGPYKTCLKSIKACNVDDASCKGAFKICDHLLEDIFLNKKSINIWDIRDKLPTVDWDFSLRVFAFLNLDSVDEILGVGHGDFILQSNTVYKAMRHDFLKNYDAGIPKLLEDKIKVLLFDGEYDLICSWLANLRLLESLKWSGRSSFLKKKLIPYKVNGKKAGEVKRVGPLTYLKVLNASHGIGDQPKFALHMIKKWMKE